MLLVKVIGLKSLYLLNCEQFLRGIDLYGVSDNINLMKTTVLFKFLFWTSFFRITSLQVNKEKFFNCRVLLVPIFCVSMLFKS